MTEPRVPVRPGWTGLLFLANLGLWLGIFAPIQVLLPEQAALLDAADKEAVFGLVTGIGAAVAVVVNPLAGALSDRTRSRFGRRHPWTLGGAVLGAVGLVVLSTATDVVAMTVGWCVVQAGLNAMLASLTSALPDRVPAQQRASVGGFIGISQMLGTVAGAFVVTMVVTDLPGGYLACALFVVPAAGLFVAFTADEPSTRLPAPTARSLWVSPRAHPDFAWGWACHLLINLGNALGTLYLLFFLDDAVHHESPEDGLLALMVIYGVALVGGAVVAGRLSDRSGRRKVYVLVAAALMAFAALLLAVSPTWPAAVVAAALLGAGFGVYWAVALALLTQVLPDAADRAKDLGVINIANALPQVIAPLAATVLLAGGYPMLFTASAVATGIAGALITRVRSVA